MLQNANLQMHFSSETLPLPLHWEICILFGTTNYSVVYYKTTASSFYERLVYFFLMFAWKKTRFHVSRFSVSSLHSSVSEIIKVLCSSYSFPSSSQIFQFRYPSFNDIMKKIMPSYQYSMYNPIGFSMDDIMICFRSALFPLIYSRTSWLVKFLVCFIFFIIVQHNISKLSKYWRSNFRRNQVSNPYTVMLYTEHLTNLLEFIVYLAYQEWYFYIKCLFGHSKSRLNFPCKIPNSW